MKYCSGCAAEIHISAPTCPKCGARQAGVIGTRAPKDRVLAVVLALLLGGIGIHKFYLGRTGWGILYLIFCWTFIPAIVAFVEAIVYALMDEHRFHEKYG